VLSHLADRVSGRLRAKRRAGRTVTVRVRFAGMQAVTRSVTLPVAVSTTLTVTEVAEALVHKALDDHPERHEISLLAVSLSNLVDDPALQLELPVDDATVIRPGSPRGSARWAVDHSIDAVRARFGRGAVDYGSVALSPRSVPDEFRELAEHDV
jgi:DNA polymerase-4